MARPYSGSARNCEDIAPSRRRGRAGRDPPVDVARGSPGEVVVELTAIYAVNPTIARPERRRVTFLGLLPAPGTERPADPQRGPPPRCPPLTFAGTRNAVRANEATGPSDHRRAPLDRTRALQDPLQNRKTFSLLSADFAVPPAATRPPFRPTPPLPFRTHVPHADHPPNEQALAPRAGAQCRRYGTRVRDAGRGNVRSSRRSGTGSPAVSGARGAAGRPHRRSPAPQAVDRSAITAPERLRPPPRTGLPDAGPSPGEQAGLKASRRPVWEDGSA